MTRRCLSKLAGDDEFLQVAPRERRRGQGWSGGLTSKRAMRSLAPASIARRLGKGVERAYTAQGEVKAKIEICHDCVIEGPLRYVSDVIRDGAFFLAAMRCSHRLRRRRRLPLE